ncbi:DUF4102 domain-containing protein [Mariprofundus sp. NF]|nr:DUF4102 domain-containing protein [Mariprofundus sp. NF]
MALSEAEIEAMKVPYGRNQFKVSDGGGLYLLVKSSGRYWKLAYRFDGKQKTLAFGVHPAVGLEEAREKREAAKALLADNIDPGELRKQERQEIRAAVEQKNSATSVQESNQRSVQQRPVAIDEIEQRMLEARRLRILSIIARTRAYTTNETALLESLHSEGFQISFDRLRTDLAWLSEQHAVQLKCGALWGIYLTQPGLDASQGSVWIPGIQKPEATTEQEQD